MAGQIPDPLLGAFLGGRYQVIELIGRGGMGNVYLGEDTRLRRRCALKVLHTHLAHDRTNVERFLREAQTIASFEHPNIVHVLADGEEPNGVVFFAMELLVGEDLETRLRSHAERSYSVHEVCVWAIQVARAVGVVHDAGFIHRDLKVSNLFLARRRDGEEMVKLLDFGIARPEDGSELTATGVTLGTPNYMSPEQVENGTVDRRADIYSFGVVLFKLLCRRLPFIGEAIQVAVQHRDSPPPRPSLVAPNAGISAALEQVVLTALAKKPSDRFPSMRAAEDALLAVLAAEAPELLAAVTRPARGGGWTATGSLPAVAVSAAVRIADATPAPALERTGATSAMVVAKPHGRSLALLAGGLLTTTAIVAVIVLGGAQPQPPPQPPPSVPAPAAVDGAAKPSPVDIAAKPSPVDIAAPPVVPPSVVAPVDESDITPPSPRPDPSPTLPLGEPSEVVTLDTASTEAKSSPTARRRTGGEVAAEVPGKKILAPLDQVKANATKCRRKHRMVDGPSIPVAFWVGTDGAVHDAKTAVSGELGACLVRAVSTVQFEPKLTLQRTLEL